MANDSNTPSSQKLETQLESEGEKTQATEENSTTLGSVLVEAPPAKEDHEYVTGIKLISIVGAVTLCCFLILLDTSIVITAGLPSITSDFSSLGDIGWYGAAYLLSSCTLQPISGKLYKQFHSKATFMVFLGTFELGSVLCGAASNSNMLIVGRAIAGAGSGGIINGALTIVSAAVPLQTRALHMGIMFGVAQIGILFGPLIGGALTEHATWRWCFYINLPIGAIVAIILFFIHIPDIRAPTDRPSTLSANIRSLDLPGFALFTPCIIMFLLALQWGGTKYAWASATVIGLFCGSAGMLLVFGAWEHRQGDTAMFPLSMLRQRVVYCACLFIFFLGANLLTHSYYMAIYFQAARGVAPTLSGVYILPSILSQMLMAVVSGALVSRLGYYLPWAVICGVMASLGSGLISTLDPDSSNVKWIFFQIIGGAGRGCGIQIAVVAIQNHLSPAFISVGMSALIFMQSFAASLFLSFAQTIFSNGLKDALPKYAPGVDAQKVIEAGATNFRSVISEQEVAGTAMAFCRSFDQVMYLVAGAGVMTFVFSWGLGWKSVKKATKEKTEV
ncbi:major facilitator superfamily domain-containing protein [Bisporella sp. PMI_857]|nr:major facilitator superfamily domain-containing protein [Bisporella sp. PMI_857]